MGLHSSPERKICRTARKDGLRSFHHGGTACGNAKANLYVSVSGCVVLGSPMLCFAQLFWWGASDTEQLLELARV